MMWYWWVLIGVGITGAVMTLWYFTDDWSGGPPYGHGVKW